MSLLKAYLSKPSTQRVLNRKPGDKGFSLIELVVVVAVLAILAAIAVPAFMGMSEEAADAAALTNLKNAYKECAYLNARDQANPAFDMPDGDAYYTYGALKADKSAGTAGACLDGSSGQFLEATTTAKHADGAGEKARINLKDGTKCSDISTIDWTDCTTS